MGFSLQVMYDIELFKRNPIQISILGSFYKGTIKWTEPEITYQHHEGYVM